MATNRQARRDYDILDTWECGVVLQGSEVKSLRESKVQLADAYARVVADEAWLIGLHVSPYSHAAEHNGHVLDRDRKLLLHRGEIDAIRSRIDQDHLTLVPLRLYFKQGRCKVEVGLGRGRKTYDKRQAIAKRDADREAQRAMARAARGRHLSAGVAVSGSEEVAQQPSRCPERGSVPHRRLGHQPAARRTGAGATRPRRPLHRCGSAGAGRGSPPTPFRHRSCRWRPTRRWRR